MTDPSLAELQDRFQRAILDGDGAFLADIIDSPREQRDVLLGVYQNAYVLRLTEILENDYEYLHAYLGDERFADLAREYIEGNPSPHRNARWFGSRLPSFLAETEPYRSHREIAEIAEIEAALNDAFDDASLPTVTLADLAAVPPDLWGDLEFTPQPFASRLDLATNAYDIWSAVKNDTVPPVAAPNNPPQSVLVYRADLTSRIRPMDADEAMMWDEMTKGIGFGVLCEMMATFWDGETAPIKAAGYLRGWIENGLLAHDAD